MPGPNKLAACPAQPSSPHYHHVLWTHCMWVFVCIFFFKIFSLLSFVFHSNPILFISRDECFTSPWPLLSLFTTSEKTSRSTTDGYPSSGCGYRISHLPHTLPVLSPSLSISSFLKSLSWPFPLLSPPVFSSRLLLLSASSLLSTSSLCRLHTVLSTSSFILPQALLLLS